MIELQPDEKPPVEPKLVFLASLFPGAGHVVLGLAPRGLRFLFFMVVLGWVSMKLMPPTSSFFGSHAGGILIYGFSIIDSYKIARVRFEKWKFSQKA